MLFVCVQNAGRSQIASALLSAQGGVRALSAGSAPAEKIHPEVLAAMLEIGMDLSGETPRSLASIELDEVDVVVTMGCGDACPVIPGKRYLDWDLPDPSSMSVDGVRALRERISALVSDLHASLLR